jgi:hypothetical protein
VTVVSAGGAPLPGVSVLTYVATTAALSQLPDSTNNAGHVLIGNVPLQSKLCFVGTVGYETIWWQNGTSHASASVVSIPAAGEVVPISIALRTK